MFGRFIVAYSKMMAIALALFFSIVILGYTIIEFPIIIYGTFWNSDFIIFVWNYGTLIFFNLVMFCEVE